MAEEVALTSTLPGPADQLRSAAISLPRLLTSRFAFQFSLACMFTTLERFVSLLEPRGAVLVRRHPREAETALQYPISVENIEKVFILSLSFPSSPTNVFDQIGNFKEGDCLPDLAGHFVVNQETEASTVMIMETCQLLLKGAARRERQKNGPKSRKGKFLCEVNKGQQ